MSNLPGYDVQISREPEPFPAILGYNLRITCAARSYAVEKAPKYIHNISIASGDMPPVMDYSPPADYPYIIRVQIEVVFESEDEDEPDWDHIRDLNREDRF